MHEPLDPKSFEGKTIARVNFRAVNIISFFFTDGTSTAIEAEGYHMVQCDECITECAVEEESA